MKYKVEVQVHGDPKWYSNELTFETEDKATDYALNLFSRWTQVDEYRVVSC